MSTELVRYDAMCRAIAEALAVDEVKEIRDKAMALEHYARQARNHEAERQAVEIRIRAERKCGDLTAEMMTAPGTRTDLTSSRGTTKLDALTSAGISKDQASQWERLAQIPAAEFEVDLADPMWRPTTSGLLERREARERGPIEPVLGDEDALWLWGRLVDFRERGLLERDPVDLLASPMHAHMRTTLAELAPLIGEWLRGMGG
jgi:hypothetical protein